MSNQQLAFIDETFVKELIEKHFQLNDVIVSGLVIVEQSTFAHRLSITYLTSADADPIAVKLIVIVRPTTNDVEAAREWTVHGELLPRFAANGAARLSSRLVYRSDAQPDIVIIEAPTTGEFAVNRKTDGLNVEQSLVAIRQLAELHAASAAFLAESPAESLRAPFAQCSSLQNESTNGRNFFREALACFIANAESMKIPASIVQKLKALQPRVLAKSAQDYAASLNGFDVLNHGNAWNANLLFRYRDGQPTEAILTDFRHAFIGSPVIDLMFFITTSVAYEVTRNHKDELLYAYHERLQSALNARAYRGYIPTLLDIHLDFLKRGIFELMLTLTVAPYLRSFDCAVRPKLVAPFVDHDEHRIDLAAIAKRVLATHAEDIIEELDTVEFNGLLDWGVESSNLKRLLQTFQ